MARVYIFYNLKYRHSTVNKSKKKKNLAFAISNLYDFLYSISFHTLNVYYDQKLSGSKKDKKAA